MQLVRIEPNENDLIDISALYRQCFNAPDKGENWTDKTAYEYFQDRVAEGSVFAILKDDNQNLMGVCCGGDYKASFVSKELDYNFDKCFYISLITISEGQQGKGLGKKILSQYCSLIQKMGFKTILVRCRAENAPMRYLLKGNNFQEIHQYSSELGGVTCERAVLKKSI